MIANQYGVDGAVIPAKLMPEPTAAVAPMTPLSVPAEQAFNRYIAKN
ncbi:MAG: hypothetical protein U1F23_04915 [Lysobacterales bacterium]